MGHSSLLGTERAAAVPAGRDNAALGPGDSSDSGSDVVGLEGLDVDDPSVPVDVALRDEASRSLLPSDAMAGAASDAGGTGERRSAASDAGRREAADIGVDRVFTPGAEADDGAEAIDEDEDEDPDLAFTDHAADDGVDGAEADENTDEGDGESVAVDKDKRPVRGAGRAA